MLAHASEGGDVQEHGSTPSHGGKEERAGVCVKDMARGCFALDPFCGDEFTERVYSVLLQWHYLSMRTEPYNPNTS